MERQWKPGDVALVTSKTSGREYRMLRRNDGNWSEPSGRFSAEFVGTARPLAVIDPEDLREVGRLEGLIDSWAGRVPYSDMAESGDLTPVTALQAALREFANPKPPKPEEPSGWGAVVEDSTGAYWTLYAPEAGVWINYREGKRRYHDIDAVRVLSEGVTA